MDTSSESEEDYAPDRPNLAEVDSDVSDVDQVRRQVRPLSPYDQDGEDLDDTTSLRNEAVDVTVNRPDENQEEELAADNTESENISLPRYAEDQSLPSIGGSDEHDDQFEDEDDQISDAADLNGHDDWDDSLPSVGGGIGEAASLQVSNAPVGGFRVTVGPDGQEQIEFASDSDDLSEEEESESEVDPPWNEMIGVEPAVEFVLPLNIVASIADRLSSRRRPGDSSNSARGHVVPLQPPSHQQITSPSLVQSRRQSSSTGGRRRRRKRIGRARKTPQKKKTVKKPAPPPKPLGPLHINEDWNGNDDFKECFKLISKIKANRVHIYWKVGREEAICHDIAKSPASGSALVQVAGPSSSVNVPTEDGLKCCQRSETLNSSFKPQGYKIGEIKFDRCGFQKWPWRNKSELLTAHHDAIQDLILYVSDQPSGSILHLKISRVLRGNQISQRSGPPPKLSKRDSERELIYNVTQHYFYYVDPVGIPADLFSIRGLGNRKTFLLDFSRFDTEFQRFHFDVVLLESAIIGDHDVHSIPAAKSSAMQDVFSNFLGITPPPLPSEEASQKEDIEWFYGQIRKFHKQEQLPPSDIQIQPATLKPELRKYQRDAVHWMLYREGCLDHCEVHSTEEFQNRVNLTEAFLKKMYIPVDLTKHISLHDETPVTVRAFYNPHTTYVCWSLPRVPPIPKGGILCDEMGLGKTVETLSLILLNEKPVPEHVREYFENEPMSSQSSSLVTSVVERKEEEISASSSEQSDSDTHSNYSDDSFEEVMPSRKRRKQEKRCGGSSSSIKTKKHRKSTCSKAVATSRRRHNRKGRTASPCEFRTAMDATVYGTTNQNDAGDSDSVSSQQAGRRPLRKSAHKARLTTKAALEAIENSLDIKKKSRVKGGTKGETSRAGPGKTYEALKILYDSALHDYKFADEAKILPKFHGKFYDTNIEMRESFECICGETDFGHIGGNVVVKCSVCGSSQHAECVGFDHELQNLFTKLGRRYLCPHCETLETPFETKSTLIITPPSISHQWIKEIQRHIQDQSLSILFYKGVSYHGYMPPAKLAKYDLVITTYNVLSAELDYVDLPHCNSADGRRFRNPKRFLSIPSPLPSVIFWRVCLDECQMVEGIGTKMSMMAMKIQAVHRWCITGTPVNKGLQDLFGLFVFLQCYPICYDIWWNVLVRDAFFRKETDLLYELFGQVIWRNGKQDVLDQLGIPPQTEVVHWLNFSPVETHFYKQQFEICSNRILDKIQRLQRMSPDVDILQIRLSSLDRFILHGLLAPFLELRQACCHPQIVKGKLISLQKGTLTMEELLDRLVKKTQLQCLEDNRQIIGALNGMAGLHIILNNWVEAAEKYREVLQSAEKYKEHFKSDSLQLLHTMENLAEILDGNHAGIAFTLRDTSLRSDAVELRQRYMKKYADAVKAAQDNVTQHSKTVEEIQNQFTMVRESWWVAVLKAAQNLQKIDGLIQSLKQDLLDISKKNQKTTNSIANRFNDRWGLEQALVPAIIEMDQLRNSVLEGLEELQGSDPSCFVESAIRCHLRQNSGSYYNDSKYDDTKCKLCQYHDNFLIYESVIFKMDMKSKISRTGRNWQQRKLLGDLTDELTDKTKDELLEQEAEDLKATTEHVQLINEELRRGTWGDSESELLLKGILRFARLNRLSQDICDNGTVHLKMLEAVKKEFRHLRILWRQIFDQVSALDELSQATTRMIAVREESGNQSEQPTTSNKIKQLSSGVKEKALKVQNLNVIGYHEIEVKKCKLQTEYITGQDALALHLGQLLYLKTLKRNGYGKRGTLNNEDCPICSVQLGKEWSVLRCGHSYCSECVKKMCPNALHSFLCPLCRHSMKFADVSFVDTTENESELAPGAPAEATTGRQEQVRKEVKGSHSTKVEAIVEKLLQLQESHPGEKCIIFSTWNDVLDIIANALTQNDIQYCLLNQPGRPFHVNLDKFKEREDLQVLLMPLTSGAKGLNIVEATHVILVEPILNLASELQAIGRVHRIGQTKPTFVHRFYVKRTIEEKLFQILKVQDVSSDEEGSLTVKNLQNLITTTFV